MGISFLGDTVVCCIGDDHITSSQEPILCPFVSGVSGFVLYWVICIKYIQQKWLYRSLNVQVCTEINDHREKEREKRYNISKVSASHSFSLNYIFFCSPSLTLSTTFHSSSLPPPTLFCLIFRSVIYPHDMEVQHTHTEYVATDDVASEICLTY